MLFIPPIRFSLDMTLDIKTSSNGYIGFLTIINTTLCPKYIESQGSFISSIIVRLALLFEQRKYTILLGYPTASKLQVPR